MALAHKTVIGSMTIDRTGNASVLLHLIVVDEPIEFSFTNYRVHVPKGANLAALGASIDAELTARGRAPLPTKGKQIIGQTLTACWNAMDAP